MRKSIFLIYIFSLISVFANDLPVGLYIRFRNQLDKNEISKIFSANRLVNFSQLLPIELSIAYRMKQNNEPLNFDPDILKNIIAAEEPLLRTYFVHPPSTNIDIWKYCRTLVEANPEIEIAEPVFPDIPLKIPNDPYAPQQLMLATIKAFDTWDYFEGDTNVVIGIVDTGVLQNHEDLQNSIAPNWKEIPDNNIDDDGNGYIDDHRGFNLAYASEGNPGNTFHTNEHGTAVAGIAGATTNNQKGIAGVANKCRIFPIKASRITSSDRIDFGYLGILYAAVRGFQVVNCSWGSPASRKVFSPIEQSIIDYAVARGVVVVVAGGNGNNSPMLWYPAGYSGVLAVGEVNQSDLVTGTTTINETIRIMAPGIGNWITNNHPNGYSSPNYGGTSWSTAVISGAVATVRAKYPQLDALQTIEYVRQLTDDISEYTASFPYVVPGRINLKKMLEVPPFSIPGIKPKAFKTYTTNGRIEERFNPGDTVVLVIDAQNYLGKAENLRFELSVADIFDNSLEVVENEFRKSIVERNESFSIGPFSFRIKAKNEGRTFLRVDIFGDNNYKDFFLVPFVPTLNIANFENDSIAFSISEKGTIGFWGTGERKVGKGIASKSLGNQLFKGGIIITEENTRIVTGLFSTNPDGSDFYPLKPFTEPNRNIAIVDDEIAPILDRIGLELEQNVFVPIGGEKYFKIHFKIRNRSNRNIKNLSVGYYLDWDVAQKADSNFGYLVPDAIPPEFSRTASAVQFVQNIDTTVIIGVGVFSENNLDVAQSALLSPEITSNFTRERQILAMNSGTALQFKGIGDISMTSGMKFTEPIPPKTEREFTMMIAIAQNPNELKNLFLSKVSSTPTERKIDEKLIIYPIPAEESISLELSENISFPAKYELVDYLGREIAEGTFFRKDSLIEISGIPDGIYFLKIYCNGKIYTQKFVKQQR
ncbi:MAG: S8 family peptidase [Ignavibacteria bacterium]|nr:S8 family peptidase [Ignavibacteria bacterium]